MMIRTMFVKMPYRVFILFFRTYMPRNIPVILQVIDIIISQLGYKNIYNIPPKFWPYNLSMPV